jgi:hypothetical protein
VRRISNDMTRTVGSDYTAPGSVEYGNTVTTASRHFANPSDSMTGKYGYPVVRPLIHWQLNGTRGNTTAVRVTLVSSS